MSYAFDRALGMACFLDSLVITGHRNLSLICILQCPCIQTTLQPAVPEADTPRHHDNLSSCRYSSRLALSRRFWFRSRMS